MELIPIFAGAVSLCTCVCMLNDMARLKRDCNRAQQRCVELFEMIAELQSEKKYYDGIFRALIDKTKPKTYGKAAGTGQVVYLNKRAEEHAEVAKPTV